MMDQLKSSNLLIIGGAGYIGSHMVAFAQEQGINVVVLDDLSTGHREMVVKDVPFYQGDLSDVVLLKSIFSQHAITAVMHFAAHIEVAESVQSPGKYYQNNVAKTISLLNAMIECRIRYFIFSSTAAVYGEPRTDKISETHVKAPINPYGLSKWMVEQICQDYASAYDFNYIALRYFNASGAHPSGHLAEYHQPETHIIPLLLQVASDQRDIFYQFGDDYGTKDGSCVRDFIHVMDLCQAHALALSHLMCGGESQAFNVGSSQGNSVRQVIEVARKVTGHPIPVKIQPRRAGDPSCLIADSQVLAQVCGWQPVYENIEIIIEHAWYAYRQRFIGV